MIITQNCKVGDTSLVMTPLVSCHWGVCWGTLEACGTLDPEARADASIKGAYQLRCEMGIVLLASYLNNSKSV